MINRNPKIACIQWRMRELRDLDEFLREIESHVKKQAALGADLVIFPELFSLGLLDAHKEPRAAMEELAGLSPAIVSYCVGLARKLRINILAGSLPQLENGLLYNVATFCHRDGRPANTQYKLHTTPYEKRSWDMQGGADLQAFDTDIGRCGILICYDVEFPELSRLLGEQDMDLLLVPFWTDGITAYQRVRFCARARAIENECYVAMTGSVGAVAGNEAIDSQYAQSAVFTPSDLSFPEQAVLAEAPPDAETSIIAAVDLEMLSTLRLKGRVQIGRDRRRDLYRIEWRGKSHMQFLPLRSRQILPYLEELARLRIKVFSEFPYLYDGNLDYEMKYLQAYIDSPRSLVLLVRDGNRAVGATTALPLADADPEFHEPFIKHGVPLETVYYFGESVLLREYRGRGYGQRFFDAREAHARQFGFPITTFCAVVRAANHPACPKDYVPHDASWSKRGYKLAEGYTCTYRWKDIGEPVQTEKQMQFWIKKT
jgi:predicted amidohydrolase/GNAT superfamily N-acetyltransferase